MGLLDDVLPDIPLVDGLIPDSIMSAAMEVASSGKLDIPNLASMGLPAAPSAAIGAITASVTGAVSHGHNASAPAE